MKMTKRKVKRHETCVILCGKEQSIHYLVKKKVCGIETDRERRWERQTGRHKRGGSKMEEREKTIYSYAVRIYQTISNLDFTFCWPIFIMILILYSRFQTLLPSVSIRHNINVHLRPVMILASLLQRKKLISLTCFCYHWFCA